MSAETHPVPSEQEGATTFWLPLRLDDCEGYNANRKQHVSEGYHYIEGGCGYSKDGSPLAGIGLAGCMSTEQAQFIINACNSHTAQQSRIAALEGALREANGRIAAVSTWLSSSTGGGYCLDDIRQLVNKPIADRPSNECDNKANEDCERLVRLLEECLAVVEEVAKDERAFWGAEDKHGIAKDADSLAERVRAGIASVARPARALLPKEAS